MFLLIFISVPEGLVLGRYPLDIGIVNEPCTKGEKHLMHEIWCTYK